MRRFLLRLVGVCLCILVYTLGIVKPAYSFDFFTNNLESSTWTYWNQLNSLEFKIDRSSCNEVEKNLNHWITTKSDLKLVSECYSNRASALSNLIWEIKSIPLLNVDEEVLYFSNLFIDTISQGVDYYNKVESFAELMVRDNSTWNVVLSFFKGALNPFLVFEDQYRFIKSEIGVDLDNLLEKEGELEKLESNVRQSLTKKYRKEFSPLDKSIEILSNLLNESKKY